MVKPMKHQQNNQHNRWRRDKLKGQSEMLIIDMYKLVKLEISQNPDWIDLVDNQLTNR